MNTTTAIVISTAKKIHLPACPKARNSKPVNLATLDAATPANCCELTPEQLAEIRKQLAGTDAAESLTDAQPDHQDGATPVETTAPGETETASTNGTRRTRNVAGRLFDDAGRDVTTYPGLVRARRARATGAIVITVRTAESDLTLDKARGKYAAVCVTHHRLTYTDVRRAANYKIPVPHEFCDGCAKVVKSASES